MSDLARYGLEWSGPKDFVCVQMEDGYWTPWHIAEGYIATLEAKLAAAESRPAVPEGWIPVTERLPIDDELVMVFIPGEDGGIDFDFIEEGGWSNHENNYQHFMAVGGYSIGGEDFSVTGPSAEAPYTHWMPLPAAPQGGGE
ncbi:DUF551 domain-containing protein [Haliea salexigens]|uniref:DUF551 domain-containing protein n=1 Tax=Haliea salexigens TaxID=287487 RepID=UPI00048145D3|nr:DUF551 domain-containing protein [Haliea salexigens]